jgi:hypothetical protein
MTGPKFTYDRGIATMAWPGSPAVTMLFDRIVREDRWDDEMSAELTVSTGSDGNRAELIASGRLTGTAA